MNLGVCFLVLFICFVLDDIERLMPVLICLCQVGIFLWMLGTSYDCCPCVVITWLVVVVLVAIFNFCIVLLLFTFSSANCQFLVFFSYSCCSDFCCCFIAFLSLVPLLFHHSSFNINLWIRCLYCVALMLWLCTVRLTCSFCYCWQLSLSLLLLLLLLSLLLLVQLLLPLGGLAGSVFFCWFWLIWLLFVGLWFVLWAELECFEICFENHLELPDKKTVFSGIGYETRLCINFLKPHQAFV